jgi:hypothetical protein
MPTRRPLYRGTIRRTAIGAVTLRMAGGALTVATDAPTEDFIIAWTPFPRMTLVCSK